jgi:class 3 adenylate cyclase/pimeloyl-ACP methyl ester carboxylesterase
MSQIGPVVHSVVRPDTAARTQAAIVPRAPASGLLERRSSWIWPPIATGDVGDTQFVRSGDGYVAFQVLSSGSPDILVVNESVLPLEALQDNVHTSAYLSRLAALGRVIVFDRRGVGLSDPASAATPLSLDVWVADAVAVLDAVGSERAAVFAAGPSAGLIALTLAHQFAERVSFLSLYDAVARYRWAPDYPWGATVDFEQDLDARGLLEWGTVRVADRHGRFEATSVRHPHFADWALKWFRRGASPSTMTAQYDVLRAGDVRDVLSGITCPTLISNHADVADGRFLAAHIPDAVYIELDDRCHVLFSPELDTVMTATTMLLRGSPLEPSKRRVLTTFLFTDIVGSTATISAIGDRRWRAELDTHYDTVRRHLQLFDGQEVQTVGDGFVAIFDGPSRAVQCAIAIQRESGQQGVVVRAGVHTGEVELSRNSVLGLTVHVTQRLCALADAAQVLVSQRVVDLVAGSDLRFDHRGNYPMKGLDGIWTVFEAHADERRESKIA